MLPSAMADVVLQAGELVGGRYRVEKLLGHGGMAVVYRARHTSTDKPCALKVVRPDLAMQRDIVELFVKEAKVGARIGEHPNIVNVFDAGIDQATGRPFLAMELLEGETLEQRLERGPLAVALLRVLLAQLVDALDQAHQAGVIHRDLKPSNLFLAQGRGGRITLKVMDFGIAKVLDPQGQRAATLAGTPSYAAPEQMGDQARRMASSRGIQVASNITPATDVWALGLLVYEMLTGLPPDHYWGATDAGELARRVLLEDVQSPTGRAGEFGYLLPAGFDSWFGRALARDARQRWQTAREAAAAVEPLLARAETTAAQRVEATLEAAPAPAVAAPAVAVTLDERPVWTGGTEPQGPAELAAPTPVPKTVFEEPALTANVEALHRRLARQPRDIESLQAMFDALGGDVDRRAHVAQALVFLGAADAESQALHRAAQAQEAVQPRRPLERSMWTGMLSHHDEDALTGEILALAAAPVAQSHVSAKRRAGAPSAGDPARVVWGRDRTERMINRCFSWAAEVMDTPPPRLCDYREQPGLTRISIVASLPPDVRLGSAAFDRRLPRELAFAAGRCLASLCPERVLLSLLPDLTQLEDVFVAALWVGQPQLSLPREVAQRTEPVARAIRRFLPADKLRALSDASRRLSARGGRAHLRQWARGAEHTAARAGMLLCDDLAAAERMLTIARAPQIPALMDDLIWFITSSSYRGLRAAMGMAPPHRLG